MEAIGETQQEDRAQYVEGCYRMVETVSSEGDDSNEFNRTVPVGQGLVLSEGDGSPLVTLSPCGIPVDMGSPISPLQMPPQCGVPMPPFNLGGSLLDRSASREKLKGPHPPSPPPPTFYSPLQARVGRKSKIPTPLRYVEKDLKKVQEENLGGCALKDSFKEKVFRGATPSVPLLTQKIRDGVVKKVVVILGPYATHCARYRSSAPQGTPLLSLELDTPTIPGLREELSILKIPSLRAAHDERLFRADHSLLCSVWREVWPSPTVKPSVAHIFCKTLHNKGLLSRVYTVNLDGLERSTGIPRSKVVEVGGTFSSAHCIDCGREHMSTFIKEKLFKRQKPICTNKACKGLVKPDVVMSNSSRTPPNSTVSPEDFETADCVFIIGYKPGPVIDPVVDQVMELTPRVFMGDVRADYEEDPDENVRDIWLDDPEEGMLQICRMSDMEPGFKECCSGGMLKKLQEKLGQGVRDIVRSMPVVKNGILRPTVIKTPCVVVSSGVKKGVKNIYGKMSPSKKASPLKVFSLVSDFNKTITCGGAAAGLGAGNHPHSRLPRSSSAGNNNLVKTPPCLKPLSAPSSSPFVKHPTVSFDLPTPASSPPTSPAYPFPLSSPSSSAATLSPLITPSQPFALPPLSTPTPQPLRKSSSARNLAPLVTTPQHHPG
eukprot:TRINITY_DN264_c0_g1_i2.p1 TRINITY_DN264_c0_g1~~TRINITY_DN264_c0_g1_i2.p1  ORF type:complete len:659 (+),score=84.20 TRINITY_DN264_c0_g1_i2:949-2925(+)